MTEYETGDWNKKIDMLAVWDLMKEDYEGWDLDDDNHPYSVTIHKIWEDDRNWQREMLVWADDNSEGYFYQGSLTTEGGTPIIRAGDKFNITLVFQKCDDAVKFKLRWI